ncbi:hypothetical protein FIBSPDRAFT_1039890 [Athelia psychrophila]|uniref:Uncharacterized protein n=1 Tax=Athelia psychrophila TaxID=1759441 RepID=A0A166R4N7_9AGAM|nr:hypothetical protein FIBSPDRAFT_1039890 [Fibularhizoctonia sp. CBS 109695]
MAYGACRNADECSVQIPFTGSGATVYVNQGGLVGVNASFVVDDKPATYSWLAPISGPTFQKSNITFFSVQNLISGSHKITLNVVNYTTDYSAMMLDSVIVNETVVTAPTSSSSSSSITSTSSPSSTVTPSAKTSHSSNVGPIVGGVIGGLVVIGLALAFFLWRRSHSKPNDTGRFEEDEHAVPQTVYNSPSSGLPVSFPQAQNASSVTSSQAPTTSATYTPYSPSRAQGDSSVPPTAKHLDNTSLTVLSPEGTSPRSPAHAWPNYGGDTGGAAELTDEQVEFINTLQQHNIPAHAVARVMERMLAGAPPSAMRGQDWMAESGVERLAPPSYEQHGR